MKIRLEILLLRKYPPASVTGPSQSASMVFHKCTRAAYIRHFQRNSLKRRELACLFFFFSFNIQLYAATRTTKSFDDSAVEAKWTSVEMKRTHCIYDTKTVTISCIKDKFIHMYAHMLTFDTSCTVCMCARLYSTTQTLTYKSLFGCMSQSFQLKDNGDPPPACPEG